MRFISTSEFGEKLVTIGIASNWLETAAALPESDLESQLIVFGTAAIKYRFYRGTHGAHAKRYRAKRGELSYAE